MDSETISQLVTEFPESYRGGRIDRGRWIGKQFTVDEAWLLAENCLADDNPARAAYWAGYANTGEET